MISLSLARWAVTVGRVGIEPTTRGLKAPCSATELTAPRDCSGGVCTRIDVLRNASVAGLANLGSVEDLEPQPILLPQSIGYTWIEEAQPPLIGVVGHVGPL